LNSYLYFVESFIFLPSVLFLFVASQDLKQEDQASSRTQESRALLRACKWTCIRIRYRFLSGLNKPKLSTTACLSIVPSSSRPPSASTRQPVNTDAHTYQQGCVAFINPIKRSLPASTEIVKLEQSVLFPSRTPAPPL
jgi:hypothetical protein